jgi:hypothetical protein
VCRRYGNPVTWAAVYFKQSQAPPCTVHHEPLLLGLAGMGPLPPPPTCAAQRLASGAAPPAWRLPMRPMHAARRLPGPGVPTPAHHASGPATCRRGGAEIQGVRLSMKGCCLLVEPFHLRGRCRVQALRVSAAFIFISVPVPCLAGPQGTLGALGAPHCRQSATPHWHLQWRSQAASARPRPRSR